MVNRILLLLLAILASFGVIVGGNGQNVIAMWAYSIGYGVIVITSLLMLAMGYEYLDKPLIIIVATIIPIAFSSGLIATVIPRYALPYFIFCLLGFAIVIVTRFGKNRFVAVASLVLMHGVSGLVILILPVILFFTQKQSFEIIWMGVGGAIIDAAGLLFLLNRTGKPIFTYSTLVQLLPGLLLLTTLAFTLGLQIL